MNINTLFSKNLVRFRKRKGLSQRELAKKVDISQRMVNYYENNPNSIQIGKLKFIADTLGIKISDFFSEDTSIQFLDKLDVRWIKKIHDIKKLTEGDRKEIIRHINSLIEKNQLKSTSTESA